MRLPSIASYAKRLWISYIIDWLIIMLIAAIGGGLSYSKPYHRPFSLLDLSLSYPFVTESVPPEILLTVCGGAPAVIIALVVFFFVPGFSFCRNSTRSQILRIKFWEFEKGWAGFALSLALAFFITQGSKNLFGKPRPDMLDRCKPDLDNIAAHLIGGFGQDISMFIFLSPARKCLTLTDWTNRHSMDAGRCRDLHHN